MQRKLLRFLVEAMPDFIAYLAGLTLLLIIVVCRLLVSSRVAIVSIDFYDKTIVAISIVVLFWVVRNAVKRTKEKDELYRYFLEKKKQLGEDWNLQIVYYFTEEEFKYLTRIGAISPEHYRKLYEIGFYSEEEIGSITRWEHQNVPYIRRSATLSHRLDLESTNESMLKGPDPK